MSEETKTAEVETAVKDSASELEALKKSIAELEAQNKNLKATLSERNSEAAQRRREAEEWEKKYNSTLSEEQQKEAERQKLAEESARELAELKRESSINRYKSKYLATTLTSYETPKYSGQLYTDRSDICEVHAGETAVKNLVENGVCDNCKWVDYITSSNIRLAFK